MKRLLIFDLRLSRPVHYSLRLSAHQECPQVSARMAGRQGFSDENFGSAPSKKQRGVCWGSLFENRENWGGRRGLNPRHSVPQTDALPAELLPPLFQSLPWG